MEPVLSEKELDVLNTVGIDPERYLNELRTLDDEQWDHHYGPWDEWWKALEEQAEKIKKDQNTGVNKK